MRVWRVVIASWHKDDHLLTHRSPHTTAVAIPWQYPVVPSVFLCPCPTIAMNNSWKIFVWFISVLLLASVLHAEECEAKKSWADIAASTTSSPSPSSTIVDHNDIPKPTASSKIETKSLSSSSPSTEAVGLYRQLPKDAQAVTVRNVYDGDTLTLVDGRRVRLLGVDTPELEEQQPYAVEAKQYTKNLCHKQEIYISFDPNSDSQDKYGRLVANVWVPSSKNGYYLCVNEGLVANGFAHVYLAKKERKPSNFQTLLKLQKESRRNKKGLWSHFEDYNVWITRYGSAFHRRDCRHIAQSKGLKQVQASTAIDEGLHPCRTCLADK